MALVLQSCSNKERGEKEEKEEEEEEEEEEEKEGEEEEGVSTTFSCLIIKQQVRDTALFGIVVEDRKALRTTFVYCVAPGGTFV